MDAREKNRLDGWLDAALKQYGEAEPRQGLEGRVLAGLRSAAPERSAGQWRWWLAVAAVAAVLVIGAAGFWVSQYRGTKKEVALVQTPSTQSQRSIAPDHVPGMTAVPHATTHKTRPQVRRPSNEVKADSRLEHFPAPRPLTDQEKMLTRYVQERPSEAKKIAVAQAQLFKKDLAEFEKLYEPAGRARKSSQ